MLRVIRTRPGRAIVPRARLERRAMERIDLGLALHPEGDMQMSGGFSLVR